MLTFRTVVLWIHLGAIICWIGGMIVIPFVVVPAVRRAGSGRAEVFVVPVVRRFQRLSRELVFVILLTGIFNLINAGALSGFSYSQRYMVLVGGKLLLFLAMAANQAWYSLVLIPSGESRRAAWSAAVNVVLAAVVLYLGLTLRFG